MKLGKEILHPIHPNHKLRMEYNETPFKCDGCKEIGIGVQYRCQYCNFDLHKACALANSPTTHPFYSKCEFKLYSRPPGPSLRVCDACRQVVRGLVYHCNKCDFDLHPCCMNLPKFLEGGDRNFYLCAKITRSCFCYGGKGLGWSYQSECRNYSVHVCCVKELLVESWHSMYYNFDKGRMKDFQMRVPNIKGPMKNHHRCKSKGKLGRVEKCCQVAGSAIEIIISAILGDPSAIIAVSSTSSNSTPTVEVIAIDEPLKEYPTPVPVLFFIFKPNQIYFVLPIAKLEFQLSGTEMANLASKAESALECASKSYKKQSKVQRNCKGFTCANINCESVI